MVMRHPRFLPATRAVSGLILAALVISLAFLQVNEARADTTGTLTITSNTNLNEDHQGNIVIAADGVTLDCQGHEVTGTGSGTGVLLNGRTGVTVKNCHVSGFLDGFGLFNASSGFRSS